MALAQESPSAALRSRLGHPVIDGDGHIVELGPVMAEYVKEVGGASVLERYAQRPTLKHSQQWTTATGTLQERRDRWVAMGPWWGGSTDAVERATVLAPRLLNDRLDEFGTDYAVLYPSVVLFAFTMDDEELRRAVCRAYNIYAMDLLGSYADRMTPVAAIPMYTPEEAVEELEYSVKTLGHKVVVFQNSVRRPIARLQEEYPEASDFAARSELYAIDSDYDYDPVWAKCVELGVAATFHGDVLAMNVHSTSSYVYNHIGFLAADHHHLSKALFLGGVTRRFPTLKFAFLEGGVGWACGLYADLIGHWEKRGGENIHALDPSRLDRERLLRLIEEYGDDRTRAQMEGVRKSFSGNDPRPDVLDEYAACGIKSAEDIRDLFVQPFYFGCEADDPMNATAFNTRANPFGARLKAIFGSDIGHWDVPVMNEVLTEAYELVEHGAITEDDFRDFTFTNQVSLHADMNPDFFKGTRVESEAAKLITAGL